MAPTMIKDKSANRNFEYKSIFKKSKKNIYKKPVKRFEQFENLCKLSQKKLKTHLNNTLKDMGYEPVNRKGYLLAKGTHPVMLIAHMDTVHDMLPWLFNYTDNGNVISSPYGLGADDRCGIYMILEIIKEINCTVLFVEDEEIGCVGANKFCKDYEEDKLNGIIKEKEFMYLVEFDRRHAQDAVYYSLDNPEFENFITTSSGDYFKTAQGSCSDISYIAPTLGIAAVNLSCGYYDEHTNKETCNIREMKASIKAAKKILNTLVENPFIYKKKEIAYYGSNWASRYYEDWDSYGYGYYGTGSSNSASKTTKEDVLEFGIVFVDYDNSTAVDYFNAKSDEEALGMWCIEHPDRRFNDVIYYDFSDIVDDSYAANKYYFEGIENKFAVSQKAGG